MLKILTHNKGRAHIQLESLSIIALGKVNIHPITHRRETRDKLEYLTAWVEQDEYLTADELCRHSGLSMVDLKELNTDGLLTPDTPDGLYKSDLTCWARELAFQLSHGVDLNKLVELLNMFWTEWPPVDPDWLEPPEIEDEGYRTTLLDILPGGNGNLMEVDTFSLYKAERLIFDNNCFEAPAMLYYDYQKWCGQNGYAITSEKDFGVRLKGLFGKPVLYSCPNEKYRLAYKGVCLKSK